ncbi:hypothetical protein M747DRAFT_120934 [Aspergillus niger ATCC 13496]|uniref:Uncharacterized protein n=1 Tax=Aspergillus niger ATCC 13496 TaxID=1353008 RepID=A0A370BS10_ASPNG|nr:hypothetical protein M747DRAFT_120934 [Aspergillus niger ATCC 13496]
MEDEGVKDKRRPKSSKTAALLLSFWISSGSPKKAASTFRSHHPRLSWLSILSLLCSGCLPCTVTLARTMTTTPLTSTTQPSGVLIRQFPDLLIRESSPSSMLAEAVDDARRSGVPFGPAT